MLKRICLAFALFVLGTSPLLAQSSVLPYFYTTGNTKVAVGNSNPLPVTISGGGGGGLSVQDQASWTQGSSNMTPVGCAYNDTATLTSGQQGTVRCNTKRAAIVDVDTSGNNLYAALTSSIPAGTNLIGDVNLRQGGTALSATNPIFSQPVSGAAGGATPTGGIAANSNNSTSIKGSAGTVYGIQTGNINSTTAYWLKLYDKATAPTCGTDTPVVRILIPPSNSGNNGTFPVGKAFTLGIGMCIVTGIADNDNTSVPAATIAWNVDYK